VELLAAPIATAEFMVVDTETNGQAGDSCEMTEVGAVLVGGGELHERWSSLCRTSMPIKRGIQRLTGISQAMVDSAPSLEDVLPSLRRRLENRIMVAHNAPFDRRVLRQAFARIGLEWPDPPVICTAALARAMLPLQNKRGLGVLADALGIEVQLAHRALADAVFGEIRAEWDRTVGALLAITGQTRLLDHSPALAAIIRARLPYIDPLNHLQIELIRRRRSGDDSEEVREGIHLTLNGVAAGLRNAG